MQLHYTSCVAVAKKSQGGVTSLLLGYVHVGMRRERRREKQDISGSGMPTSLTVTFTFTVTRPSQQRSVKK